MTDFESDLDAIVAEIRERVRAGRESGVYTDDLEAELQSDFARQLTRRDPALRFDALHQALRSVDVARQLGPERVTLESGIPGGEVVHRALSKAVSRQINGMYQQVRTFADSVVPMFDELIRAISDAPVHVHEDVVHDIDVLNDRVAALQRSIDRLGAAFTDGAGTMARLLDHLNFFDGVSPRLAALEERERRRGFDPFFEYGKFEDVARGSIESVVAEYAPLADRLASCPGPVIDLGAGRGEFVGLLSQRGATAWGVDIDTDLVAAAQRNGLDLRLGDAVDTLRAAPLSSLGGVVLLHVVEHLSPNEVLDVIQFAYRALAVGGQLVIETPNPQSLYVFARAFWLDPTHTKPIHPVYLDFVLRSAGFSKIEFEWTAMPDASERLDEVDEDSPMAKFINQNARKINELLFAAQNYRVTAYR